MRITSGPKQWRYTLRFVLLIAIPLVALLANWIRGSVEQRRLVSELRARGFGVGYSSEHDESGAYISNPGNRSKVFVPAFVIRGMGEDFFHTPVSLWAEASDAIDNDDLKLAVRLRNVRSVTLTNTMITDEGIAHFEKLPRLCSLQLHYLAITDASISSLARLEALDDLTLYCTNVSKEACSELQKHRPYLTVSWTGKSSTDFNHADWPERGPVVPKPVPSPLEPVPVPDGHREMVLIPAGEYTFGPYDTDATFKRHVDSFYIDRYEVSCVRYQAFLDATGHPPPPEPEWWPEGRYPKGAENLPAFRVRWEDAAVFAIWEGKRLPTVDEWEVAARGADTRKFPWGDEGDVYTMNNFANEYHTMVRGKAFHEYLMPIDSFPNGASPFDVFNLVGNVIEWTATEDGWGGHFLKGSIRNRVPAGGPGDDTAHPYVGFRCAKSVEAREEGSG